MATSVKLDDALKSRVEQVARQQDRSAHWIMREAIRQYVERQEARGSFLQEAMAAWAHYQETGLHLTGEEVIDWLEGNGGNPAGRLPNCHK